MTNHIPGENERIISKKHKRHDRTKSLKLHRKKALLPPGTALSPEKETPTSTFSIHAHWIDHKNSTDSVFFSPQQYLSFIPPTHRFCWLHLAGIEHAEQVKIILSHFHIHELAIEDVVSTVQRPKIEEFDSFLFVIARRLSQIDHSLHMTSEQVGFFLLNSMIITFEEGNSDLLDLLKGRLRSLALIQDKEVDHIGYIFIDTLVDSFFLVLDTLNTKLDSLEEEVLIRPSTEHLPMIYSFKSVLASLRKIAWPLREMASSLERSTCPYINQRTKVYLRDVYDHTYELVDILENLRDMSTGLLEVYLSSVNNRLSEVMKALTVIVHPAG
jgi:magnesium transporter